MFITQQFLLNVSASETCIIEVKYTNDLNLM